MARQSKTFRIFISSPFCDFKEERNALQEIVFPKLRELCQQHKCKFQAIDLRWGIREEAALDQQTMKTCFKEIARCQKVTPYPNFIILLGDRYGWRPLPYEIESEEFEEILKTVRDPVDMEFLKRWYKRDDNALPSVYDLQPRTGQFKEPAAWDFVERRIRSIFAMALEHLALEPDKCLKYNASATEQEIARGTFGVKKASKHIFAYFRSIRVPKKDGSFSSISEADLDNRFVDFADLDSEGKMDREAYDKLDRIKKRLCRFLRGNVYRYETKWTGAGISYNHIEKLCEDVYASLYKEITGQIQRMAKEDPLNRETEAHDIFGKERSMFFVGRQAVLQTIADYLNEKDRGHVLALIGGSGSGKTSTMARAVDLSRQRFPDAEIIARFVGATPSSTTCRSLLDNLCSQISRDRSPGFSMKNWLKGQSPKKEFSIPNDFKELTQLFPKKLKLATRKKPLILFIDALDQLSEADNARNLSWLPTELPDHAKIVVSATDESVNGATLLARRPEHRRNRNECITVLRKRLPHDNIVEMPCFPGTDAKQLLDSWFKKYGRKLQSQQIVLILSAFKNCPLPLYLKLAFEEAKRWKSYDLNICLGTDIPSLIRDLYKRLSSDSNHGEFMVSRSIGYLAAAKCGLSEDELLDVLSSDDDLLKDFAARSFHKPPEKRLPIVLWSRLYFDLGPYLIERMGDGASLIGFYHRQFHEALEALCSNDLETRDRHKALADYFKNSALWHEVDEKKTPNRRKVSELPYQQTAGRLWPELEKTLCDLEFIEAKSLAGMLYDLLRDYDEAIESDSNLLHSISHVRRILRLTLPRLAERLDLAMQTLYNQLLWIGDDKIGMRLRKAIDSARCELNARGYWISAQAPFPETETQSVSLIPFGIESSIQSLSLDGSAIAIASPAGDVEIRSLHDGEPIGYSSLDDSKIESIALNLETNSIAYINKDGVIRLQGKKESLEGRKDDKLLKFHPSNRILAIRSDNDLVLWDPESGSIDILDANVPSPLVSMRIASDGRSVITIAGFHRPSIRIIRRCADSWHAENLLHCDSPIIDADIDNCGDNALIACRDRSLRIICLKTNAQIAKTNYMAHPDESIMDDAPARCAIGSSASRGWAFFITRTGQVAAWNWSKEELKTIKNDNINKRISTRKCCFEVLRDTGQLFLSSESQGEIVTGQKLGNKVCKRAGSVENCVVTDHRRIVATSRYDNTVRWHTCDGLKVLKERTHVEITAISKIVQSDDVLLGDVKGWIWRQSPDEETKNMEIFCLFPREVASLFSVDGETAIAADIAGRSFMVNLIRDRANLLRLDSGFCRQQRIFPARDRGLYWSLYRHEKGNIFSIFSIISKENIEKIIYRSRKLIEAADVSHDANAICLAGSAVKIYRPGKLSEWSAVYKRQTPVTHIAFLDKGNFLVAIRGDKPWLQIWHVSKNLPTVAAMHLPGQASSLSANKKDIAVGLKSGHLLSLCLRGPEDMTLKENDEEM